MTKLQYQARQQIKETAMINSTDPRYDRTESDLLDAFKILAGQKALNKISVSEITKLTGVTRSTFYNHYEDMPAFINAMEDRIIDEIFQIMNSFKPEGNLEICHQFFRSLCEYMKANRFLMIIIATPEAYDFVEKALTMFHRYVRLILEKSSKTGLAQEKYSYAVAYAIGGVVGILHKFAVDNCQESSDKVSAFLTESFLDGMRPYLGI